MQVIRVLNNAFRRINNVTAQIKGTTLLQKYAHSSALPEVKQIEEFSFYQLLFEKALIFGDNLVRFSRYSRNPEVSAIEKTLAERGVAIRFRNDLETAKFIQQGIEDINNAGYEVPKSFLLVHPMLILNSDGAAILFRKGNALKAPVLLPKTIKARSQKNIAKKYKLGIYSTDNVSHYIYHESGHWLHFQNKPSLRISQQIWQTADKEMIEHDVSQMALKLNDGTEFVAEVFAGLMDGKEYNEHIMDIYRKLKGPIKKH